MSAQPLPPPFPVTKPPQNWYPTLAGLVPQQVERAFRVAFDLIYQLRGQVSSASATTAQVLTVTPPPNGSLTKFTLSATPKTGLLIRNGVVQLQGVGKDYTLSGNSIIYAAAPLAGDWHSFLRLS